MPVTGEFKPTRSRRSKMRFTNKQCEEVRHGLSAMFDGAVGAAEEAALNHHLEICPNCAAYERDLRELEGRICDHLTEQCDEDRIWTQVLARIDTCVDNGAVPGDRRRWRTGSSTWRRTAAAVVVCGLVLVGGWHMLGSSNVERSILAATTEDFGEFKNTGNLLDVSGLHPDAIARWMTARIDFDLPKKIVPPAGLQIAGGRLCSFLGRKLAFFAFSKGSKDVGLYVTRADGLHVPRAGGFAAITWDSGLSAISWYNSGLAYVAVADLPISGLAVVAEGFQRSMVQ